MASTVLALCFPLRPVLALRISHSALCKFPVFPVPPCCSADKSDIIEVVPPCQIISTDVDIIRSLSETEMGMGLGLQPYARSSFNSHARVSFL